MDDLDSLDKWFLNETNRKLFPGSEITKIVHMGEIRKAVGIPFSMILPREGLALGEIFETVAGAGDGYLYLLPREEN